MNDDVLDYGTVGTLENRTLTFKIVNKNPVEVSGFFKKELKYSPFTSSICDRP